MGEAGKRAHGQGENPPSSLLSLLALFSLEVVMSDKLKETIESINAKLDYLIDMAKDIERNVKELNKTLDKKLS